MAGLEKKKEGMKARSELKGDRETIEDNLTVDERKIRWKIGREAQKEKLKGNKVQVGYMKIWVNGEMKIWNEWGRSG